MFVSGTVTDAIARANSLMWPLLLFVVEGDQLEQCEELIRTAGLQSTAVMQLILVGTEEHKQFQCLVKEASTPRVHIFANNPAVPSLPPLALTDANFTAQKIAEAVFIATEWSDTFIDNLTNAQIAKVEAIDKEAARYNQQRESTKLKNSFPAIPGGKAPPVAESSVPTARAAATQLASPAAATKPPGHLVPHHYIELSVFEKREVIFQTDTRTTLRSLWEMAERKAKRALDEGAAAAQLGVLLRLQVVRPDSDVQLKVNSAQEGEGVFVHTLPPKTVVTAVFGQREAVVPKPEIVCDGNTCHIRPKQAAPVATPSVSSLSTSTTISVRCSLPDGSQFVVADLTPASQLHTVRTAVVEHLSHGDFALYNSYPPRRFTDEEQSKTLKELGLERNATVRVVMLTSLQQAPARAQAAPAPAPSGAATGQAPGLGFVGSALQRLWGGSNPPPQPQQHQLQPAQQPPPPTRPASSGAPRFASMASLRQQENEEDNDEDPTRPKKSNRYFGGTSTEYEGK